MKPHRALSVCFFFFALLDMQALWSPNQTDYPPAVQKDSADVRIRKSVGGVAAGTFVFHPFILLSFSFFNQAQGHFFAHHLVIFFTEIHLAISTLQYGIQKRASA